MPTSGGLYRSLQGGKDIDCSAVQLFTCSPRQWSHPSLKEEHIKRYLDVHTETGMGFTVAHDSYLINLAAPSEEILTKSKVAFESELDRANQLNIRWLVTHMGAHLNQGEDEALARLANSLREILELTDAKGYNVGIALETTAGQGTGLGWRFEHLGRILADVGNHPRLGVCLDTCHVFVAGYDLRTEEAYESTWQNFDENVGYDKLKVIHANDAKKPLGSRVDRHEHIGAGEIGIEAFGRLVTDLRFQHVPIIVETPDSDTMHAVNVAKLRKLSGGLPPLKSVSVQLFGHYRDIALVGDAGADRDPDGSMPLRLAYDANVAEFVRILEKLDSRFKDLAAHCRFAVNDEYCDLAADLPDGCSIAVLPPVSGG